MNVLYLATQIYLGSWNDHGGKAQCTQFVAQIVSRPVECCCYNATKIKAGDRSRAAGASEKSWFLPVISAVLTATTTRATRYLFPRTLEASSHRAAVMPAVDVRLFVPPEDSRIMSSCLAPLHRGNCRKRKVASTQRPLSSATRP